MNIWLNYSGVCFGQIFQYLDIIMLCYAIPILFITETIRKDHTLLLMQKTAFCSLREANQQTNSCRVFDPLCLSR
jgi:hypothetical protein